MIDRRRALGVALALGVGALLAVQSRINGELGEQLHDGVLAALISFGTGLVVLLAITAGSARMRAGVWRIADGVRSQRLRWWQLCGGVSGAYLVTCQGLTIGAIGLAVFTVAVVAGQAASGLAVDRLGLGPAGAQRITTIRVLAAVGSMIGVLIAVSDRLSTPTALGLAVLPLIAGLGISWQAAVNGQVGVVAQNPLPAALVNFSAGTAVLAVAATVDVAVRGLPAAPPAVWLYVGGPLGIPVIVLSVLVVRWIGVLLLGLAVVAGQIGTALLLDLVAPAAQPPSAATVLGCLVALAVVVGAGLGSRDPARRTLRG